MITNLIFDLSGYGGSANFTAATTTDLINELNTLTGVAWYWDPADCKPKSNFYPGVPPVITTQYKVSFVDIDNDSTGFCNAGSLDFTKFTEIDLTAYGGSANTAVANNTDIVNAFVALSLTVSVSGCDLIIDNWNHTSVPSNVEVNNTASCTITAVSMPGFSFVSQTAYEMDPINPFEVKATYLKVGSDIGVGDVTVDWGDGNIINYSNPGIASFIYTYAAAGIYTVSSSFTDLNGNLVTIIHYLTIDSSGNVKCMQNNTTPSPKSFRVNNLNTPFTFNTSNCAAVTWSATLPTTWSGVDLGTTYEVEVTVGGVTTTVPLIVIGPNRFGTFTNIPFNFTGLGAYPITINYKCDGIVTGSFTGNIYLS